MPRGSVLIIWVEFWERFSFYGMLTLFVLFLTAPVADDGFGWTKADALSFLGIYTGLMYGMPVLGGYLADKLWGERRAVLWGSLLLTVGHFLMAGPIVFPWLMGGGDTLASLAHHATSLGGLTVPDVVAASGLGGAYMAASLSFYGAIACLVLGNALMKSTLVVLVGDQFPPGDVRKDFAYTAYYLSISVAGLVSGVSVGLIGEKLGWHFGFSIAGFGMATACLAFWFLHKSWVHSGRRDTAKAETASADRFTLSKVLQLVIPGTGLCIFMTGWFHVTGSWVLFFADSVDRSIFTVTVPETWLLPINSALVLAAAPVLAWMWSRLANAGRIIGYPTKIALALGLGAAAHAAMYGATLMTAPGLLLPMVAIFLVSIGEITAWVPAYGYVYDTAPSRSASLAMGCWFLGTLSLSGYLSGQIGTLIDSGGYSSVFGATALITIGACLILIACRPLLTPRP